MINYYFDKKNYRSSSIVHRAVSSFKTDYTQKTHSHTTGFAGDPTSLARNNIII